jgi:hypothetical protein
MPNFTLNRPCRIVCEGPADREFFNSLIRIRGINNCEADCARADKDQRCLGRTGITPTLRGLKGFAEIEPDRIRGVIIAVDTDHDPRQRLREIIGFIIAGDLNSPNDYLEIRRHGKGSEFDIAILGIPWGNRPGNLDLLLFEAMRTSHADLMAPLDDFCDRTRARNGHWAIGPKSKMRLRCTLAASYEDDPGRSLSYLLQSKTNPIDLNHNVFDAIAEFLTTFEQTATR